MACHKHSLQLIISFPLVFPMLSHAVNVGDTYIQSGQNEPLNASINVSDIDPKTFSVKVATPEMYKQLGLSDEQAVSAKFEPTSSNGGKIVLTTAQPVATPYADVVLNIENKGEKNLLPKTLLMPLNGSQQVVTQPQTDNAVIKRPKVKKTIAKNAAIDLPVATAVPAGTPLIVRTEAPPDLAMTTLPDTSNINNVTSTPTIVPPPVANTAIATPAAITANNASPSNTNLVIQETRRFTPVTNVSDTNSASATPAVPPTESKPEFTPETPVPATKTNANAQVPAKTLEATGDNDDDTTYVIQRNDNLWTIASRVAKSSHKNVHQVMQDIVDENPDSFENGDPARMVANTELDIPNYETMPSAAGIKAARHHRSRAVAVRAAPTKTDTERLTAKHNTSKSKHHPKQKSYRASHAITKTKIQTSGRPKPAAKPQLTIVSANKSNGNAQGHHPSDATDNHGTNSQLIDQVKQRREATANQASRVNQLSGAVSSSEQKLRLQNEKLAMLEKRLKELNKS